MQERTRVEFSQDMTGATGLEILTRAQAQALPVHSPPRHTMLLRDTRCPWWVLGKVCPVDPESASVATRRSVCTADQLVCLGSLERHQGQRTCGPQKAQVCPGLT